MYQREILIRVMDDTLPRTRHDSDIERDWATLVCSIAPIRFPNWPKISMRLFPIWLKQYYII